MTAASAQRPPVMLLVDDNAALVEMLRAVFEEEFEVLQAHSGSDAMRVIETNAVDVVLLDVLLPGLDGLGVLSRLKAVVPGIAVIVLTGVRNVHIAVAAMKLGAFDYVTKPFDVGALRALVHGALALRPSVRGATKPAELCRKTRSGLDPVLLIGTEIGELAACSLLIDRHVPVRTALNVETGMRLLGGRVPALIVLDVVDGSAGWMCVAATFRTRFPNCPMVVSSEILREPQTVEPNTIVLRRHRLDELLMHVTALLTRPGRAGGGPNYRRGVVEAFDHIGQNYSKNLAPDVLAAAAGFSARHLGSLLLQATGWSAMECVVRVRVEVAKCLLTDMTLTIENVAERCGFSDASHLSRTFVRVVGQRPGQFRRARAA